MEQFTFGPSVMITGKRRILALSSAYLLRYASSVVSHNLLSPRNGVSGCDAEAIPMSTSFTHLPPDNTPKESAICRICGKPVPVNTAKEDACGEPIHEECYAVKVQFEQAGRLEQAGRDLEPVHGVSDTCDGHAGTSRPWKFIAEEVTRERDPKRVGELVDELNRALDEQRIHGAPKPKPDGEKTR